MPGRQVFGLELRAASGAVVLEDAAPRRVGRKRELVALRVDQRTVDLLRIAVVDQRAFLVVSTGRGEILPAAPAHPPLRVEIDLQVLRHGNTHHRLRSSVSSRSPAAVVSKRQPAGSRIVKNGPSITAGPTARAPGGWSTRPYTSKADEPPVPSSTVRVPVGAASDSATSPAAVTVTCGSGDTSDNSNDATSPDRSSASEPSTMSCSPRVADSRTVSTHASRST